MISKEDLAKMHACIDAQVNGTLQVCDDSRARWFKTEVFSAKIPLDRYRIKPTPTYRAWLPSELPVGAVLKYPDGSRGLINTDGLTFRDRRLADFVWKWPHEPDSAYRPCGVLE